MANILNFKAFILIFMLKIIAKKTEIPKREWKLAILGSLIAP